MTMLVARGRRRVEGRSRALEAPLLVARGGWRSGGGAGEGTGTGGLSLQQEVFNENSFSSYVCSLY